MKTIITQVQSCNAFAGLSGDNSKVDITSCLGRHEMSPVLALHALQSQSGNSHTPAVCFAVVSLPSPPISQIPNEIPSLWLRQALFFSFSISLTPATHSSVDLPQVAHAVMVCLPTQLWAIPVRQLAVPPSSKTD